MLPIFLSWSKNNVQGPIASRKEILKLMLLSFSLGAKNTNYMREI